MTKKILVLLDMNGTLCYRNEMPVTGAKEDLYIRRKYFYARGGIDSFVTKLHGSGYFCICPYSSMMEHNLRAGLKAIFPVPTMRNCFHRVLDRDMNKPDPAGAEEWDTVRDVQKVWRHLGPADYGPENTILLDNEARKFQETPRNGIVVPEFGPREVRKRDRTTMNSLLKYLLDLGAEQPKDVREYMEKFPFGKQKADTTKSAVGKEDVDSLASAMLKTTISQQPPAVVEDDERSSATDYDALTDPSDDSTEASSDHSATVISGAPTAPTASTAGSSGVATTVPPGTRLELICLEGESFIMRNATVGVTVKGSARKGLRIDRRMDCHRLLKECTDCEVTMETAEAQKN